MESFSVDLGRSADVPQRFCRHFTVPQTVFAADFRLLRVVEDTPAVARKLETLVYLGNVYLGWLPDASDNSWGFGQCRASR